MAKLTSILAEDISGKVGNLLFYKVRGEQRVRTLPAQINDPRSRMQLMQRNRFKLLNYYGQCFKPACAIGYVHRPSSLSVFNYFMRLNAKWIWSDESGKSYVEWSKICCSQGDVVVPQGELTYNAVLNSVVVHVQGFQVMPSALKDDEEYLYMVDATRKYYKLISLGQRDRYREIAIYLDNGVMAENLQFYLFASNATGDDCSNTRYIVFS